MLKGHTVQQFEPNVLNTFCATLNNPETMYKLVAYNL